MNLEIADDSGSCQLVLWNGDIDSIKNKEIKSGTQVKIINGYTKTGYTGGMEIHLGRWGLLEAEPYAVSSSQQTKEYSEEITGVLLLKEPTKAFFKDDGEVGFVTSITMKQQNIQKELILWDQNVKDIQPCRIGDTIWVRNITKKWCNGKTELWHKELEEPEVKCKSERLSGSVPSRKCARRQGYRRRARWPC